LVMKERKSGARGTRLKLVTACRYFYDFVGLDP
jgi:hypothetical protein